MEQHTIVIGFNQCNTNCGCYIIYPVASTSGGLNSLFYNLPLALSATFCSTWSPFRLLSPPQQLFSSRLWLTLSFVHSWFVYVRIIAISISFRIIHYCHFVIHLFKFLICYFSPETSVVFFSFKKSY